MEAPQEIQVGGAKQGFFNHMTNLKKGEKSELYNVLQYSVLALLPLIILIRINQNLWPKADEKKGTVELLAEILGQTILLFLGIFFIHRLITFVPTYSGRAYGSLNIFNLV